MNTSAFCDNQIIQILGGDAYDVIIEHADNNDNDEQKIMDIVHELEVKIGEYVMLAVLK